MIKYEEFDFKDKNSYIKYYLDTLLPTNHKFTFFVDWSKVYRNIETHLYEISLLNSLNMMPKDKIEDNFRKLITNNPEIVPILPSILAIRFKKKNYQVPILDDEYKEYDFNKDTFNVDDIVKFSKETGILALFSNIKDLKAYLLGTEVGLDTNARKNRSGKSFENILNDLIREKLKSYPEYAYNEQVNIKEISRNKYFDFVIFKNNIPEILIECNFYNSNGSKPIETGHAYIDLQKQIEKEDMIFIWVSDGKGWDAMHNVLDEFTSKIHYMMNYTIFKDNFGKILDLI